MHKSDLKEHRFFSGIWTLTVFADTYLKKNRAEFFDKFFTSKAYILSQLIKIKRILWVYTVRNNRIENISASPKSQPFAIKKNLKHQYPFKDITLHPSEIEARLRDVTVFALVDSNSAFIRITGELDKSLCPFFMTREMALAYQSKLVDEAPEMMTKTHITAIGLDRFYKYKTSDNYEGEDTKNTIFRIIPDPNEVENALQILQTSKGNTSNAFSSVEGVPLFQVESLEVKPTSGALKATPLFFSKKDADLAAMSAYTVMDKRKMSVTQEAVSRAQSDVCKKTSNLQKAALLGNSKLELRYQNQVDKALKRLQNARTRQVLKNNTNHSPKIEVGCLEWVVQQMEEDNIGVWTEIVFIPQGFIDALHSEFKGS